MRIWLGNGKEMKKKTPEKKGFQKTKTQKQEQIRDFVFKIRNKKKTIA